MCPGRSGEDKMVVENFVNNNYRAQILLINYTYKVLFYNNNNLVKLEEYKGKTLQEVKEICQLFVNQS